MEDAVLLERHGSVALLTINRPDARNAINAAVSHALGSALDAIEDDAGVAVVVLTGAGDRAFCAGMDLKAFAAGESDAVLHASGGFAGIARRTFTKPIVAAVNGFALAGGLEIVLSCDLVVASEHATFGIPEVTRGLIAGAGGLFRLPRRVPLSIALELALTGDPIDARRAHELGLVNHVVPAGALVSEALALAARIARNAPLALATTKSTVLRGLAADEAEGWRLNDEAVEAVFGSEDALEGATAFAEKRPPRWSGR